MIIMLLFVVYLKIVVMYLELIEFGSLLDSILHAMSSCGGPIFSTTIPDAFVFPMRPFGGKLLFLAVVNALKHLCYFTILKCCI